MAEEMIFPIRSKPGIKRDGTMLEGDAHVDGRWVRWQRGLARKIGGYRSVNKYLQGLPRDLHTFTQDAYTYVHAGSANRLERFYIDSGFNVSVVSNRTPAGLAANANNLWQFDTDTSAAVSGTHLVAHVAANLDIANSTGGQIFYGPSTGTGTLTQTTAFPAGASLTGGTVALHPYTVVFGNDGYVLWGDDFTDFTVAGSGSAYVTGQKIVRGMALRGGPGSSPSGLLWSLDSLVRMTYIGGTATFQFDTISTESSILSTAGVIEYDGIYFWPGTDRFLMFNGVVREVPNELNLNFFFDNINMEYRQKVFAFKVPRFGEIWWCFPYGDSTEPNWAVIYNVRENTWYDTPLGEGGRGAGSTPAVFGHPILTGVSQQNYIATAAAVAGGGTGYTVGDVLTVVGGAYTIPVQLTVASVSVGAITGVNITAEGNYTSTPANNASVTGGTGSGATFLMTYVQPYKVWVHETGTDAIDGSDITPINSYFETADIALPTTEGITNWLHVDYIEPDFVQTGDMTVQVHGRVNARAPEVEGEVMTFPATASTPEEQIVFLKESRRQLRFRFGSDTVGGDYQQGLCLGHFRKGDGSVIG